MKVGVKWVRDCCGQAVRELNNMGVCYTESPRTVTKWNREYHKLDLFDHPDTRLPMAVGLVVGNTTKIDLIVCIFKKEKIELCLRWIE